MQDVLAKIIQHESMSDLDDWYSPNWERFSAGNNLFKYQEDAIRSIVKALRLYFADDYDGGERAKGLLSARYRLNGVDSDSFSAKKYDSPAKKRAGIVNKRFSMLQNYFKIRDDHISGSDFLNRACFWMATGSGKSWVLIKTIELTDYLMAQGLIPRRDIMLLLPREDLVSQFAEMVENYNSGRDRQIELVNLKGYDDDKHSLALNHTIKVYYYRSDLLRDARKENTLDYRNYENGGKWYVFLDEAHRGEKQNSKLQDYISVLSREGFLFNFSATFTDALDHATTCYNYNLEKFINDGYGKNIYLSKSHYDFNERGGDLNEAEKQKQVLKSLIVFAAIRKSGQPGGYHNPLMMTLVNSVNTEESDMRLFFKELEKVAKNKVQQRLFDAAKAEICAEFSQHKKYMFGGEELDVNGRRLSAIAVKDILQSVFNAKTPGKIEILPGESGKEVALKLETSEKPFALIKIGDTGKFQREHLGGGYKSMNSFMEKSYFETLNASEDINLLMGSRSFYEGWDSNRPNVVNFINIGKGAAKKYVLQAIGRGVRIEPTEGERRRLPEADGRKNKLLETLFVFATDRSAVQAIIETVQHERKSDDIEVEIALGKNMSLDFDLLIPRYGEKSTRENVAKFNISRASRDNFNKYLAAFDDNALLIKTGGSRDSINALRERANGGDYQLNANNVYGDMNSLLARLISHFAVRDKVVDKVEPIRDDDIIHFNHIKVINFMPEEVKAFKANVDELVNYMDVDKDDIERQFKDGKISRDEFFRQLKMADTGKEAIFRREQNIIMRHVAQHYYLPLIYSEHERADFIKHIIKVPSEVNFVKGLSEFISEKAFDFQWMFSKIDESLDKLHIPYFYGKNNIYRNFHPDFVFWLRKGRKYKIVFVDPKGTEHTDYQHKVDEFEKLFMDGDTPRVFNYKRLQVTFDLKLVASDINRVARKYREYWLAPDQFTFLSI